MRSRPLAYTQKEIAMRQPESTMSAGNESECPSLIDLAAWADGRLSEDEAARIELHVARCAGCLETVAGLDLDAPADLVSERVIEAATRLVPTENPSETGGRFVFATFLRRGLAAAAAVGIAWAGYAIGTSLCESLRSGAGSAEADPAQQFAEASSDAPSTTIATSDDDQSDIDNSDSDSNFLSFGVLGSEAQSDLDVVELASRLLLEVSQ